MGRGKSFEQKFPSTCEKVVTDWNASDDGKCGWPHKVFKGTWFDKVWVSMFYSNAYMIKANEKMS